MAELGTIDVVPVNSGVRPIDRTSELRALDNALNIGMDVVETVITNKVGRDLEEAIIDSQVESEEEGASVSTDISSLEANIDRLRLQVEQGRVSQRTLAEMQLNDILTKAKVRYPWLRDKLTARAGQVLAGSAELERLGFKDAAAKALASSAQSQIDDIQRFATKSWEEKGLGMDPTIPFGSPQWLAQYEDLSNLRAAQEARSRKLSIITSIRELGAEEAYDTIKETLQGKTSAARADTYEIFNRYGFYNTLQEVGKGDGANLEAIQQFHTQAVPLIIQSLEQQKVEIAQAWDQLRISVSGTSREKELDAQVKDFISERDSIISKFRVSVEQLPDAMRLISAQETIRGAELMRGLSTPSRNFLTFTNGYGKGLIEIAKLSHTEQGIVTGEKLGTRSVSVLQEMFPQVMGSNATPDNRAALAFMTSGQGTITPDMDPFQINASLSGYQRDAENPWLVKTGTDRQELVAAALSADNHVKIWSAVLNTPEEASPAVAATYLTGLNSSLLAFNSISEKPREISEIMRAGLSDERLQTALGVVGDDPAVLAQRRAFGTTATDWYESTNPRKRRDEAIQIYNNATVGGVVLNQLVRVDIDAMSQDGTFAYEIDKDAFNKAVKGWQEKNQWKNQGFNVNAPRDRVQEEIIKAMIPIAREVNESLTINRNLEVAKSVSVVDDAVSRGKGKLRLYDELGWLEAFNYTTSTK